MDYSKIKIDFKIEQVNSGDLYSPVNFESLKYTAYNLMVDLDWDGILQFANVLEKKLLVLSPENDKESYIYGILEYWLLRMRLFAYGSLRPSEKTELFKRYLVVMLQMALDVKKPVFKFLDMFDSPNIIKEETTSLISILNNSQEYLGNSKNFPAGEFKPTVINWIREYQGVLKPTAGMSLEPGAFHIVKFLDSNKYVKFLSQEEKEILRNLFDLYNSLLNPIVYVDDRQLGRNSPYIQSQKFELSEEVLRLRSDQPRPPVVPAPKGRGEQREMGDVQVESEKLKVERKGQISSVGTGGKEIAASGEAIDSLINQKPQLSPGSLADSDTVREKSSLLSINRLAQPEKLVNSGGREGTRTPRVTDSKPDSAPYPAHSNELYHTSAQNTPSRVNFQDILNSREQGQSGLAGLKMGEGGGGSKQISNFPSSAKASNFAKASSDKSEGKQFPISSKETGGKTLTPNPSPGGRGEGIAGNNPSSFILNPLLGKKPAAQNGQSKQAEIDRKLEELGKRIKN